MPPGLRQRPFCRDGQRTAEGPRRGPNQVRSACGITIFGAVARIHPLKRDPDASACRLRHSTFPACSLGAPNWIRRPVLSLCRTVAAPSVGEPAHRGCNQFPPIEDVLGMQHLGVPQLLGNAEAVDEGLRDRPQCAAAFVDALGDCLARSVDGPRCPCTRPCCPRSPTVRTGRTAG